MTLTQHGHHIPGTVRRDENPEAFKARCGGVGLCRVCQADAYHINSLGNKQKSIYPANYWIMKWPVMVDGESHDIPGGDVLLVAHKPLANDDVVNIWTLEPVEYSDKDRRWVRVFRTGEAIEMGVTDKFLGSCVTPGGYVWHVFEIGSVVPR